MIQIGYYTIGKGMRNKQVHYNILGECKKKGINLYVKDYKNTGIILLSLDIPHAHTTNCPFCVWEKITPMQLKYTLLDIEIILSRKYKSLRWIINGEKLKELIVLNNI